MDSIEGLNREANFSFDWFSASEPALEIVPGGGVVDGVAEAEAYAEETLDEDSMSFRRGGKRGRRGCVRRARGQYVRQRRRRETGVVVVVGKEKVEGVL